MLVSSAGDVKMNEKLFVQPKIKRLQEWSTTVADEAGRRAIAYKLNKNEKKLAVHAEIVKKYPSCIHALLYFLNQVQAGTYGQELKTAYEERDAGLMSREVMLRLVVILTLKHHQSLADLEYFPKAHLEQLSAVCMQLQPFCEQLDNAGLTAILLHVDESKLTTDQKSIYKQVNQLIALDKKYQDQIDQVQFNGIIRILRLNMLSKPFAYLHQRWNEDLTTRLMTSIMKGKNFPRAREMASQIEDLRLKQYYVTQVALFQKINDKTTTRT